MRAVSDEGPGTSDVLVDEAFGGRPGSDERVACRLLALANALDSMSRRRAACQAGLERQTLRSIRSGRRGPDPVALIERGDPLQRRGVAGLRDRPKSGRPAWLDEGQLAAFKALMLRGPAAGCQG